MFQVGSTRDDASASSGVNFVFEKYLRVGTRMSGMRFAGVDISRGSTIVSARLKIFPLSTQLESRLDGLVQAEVTGNAPDFLAGDRYLCNLPRTNASVAWVWQPEFDEGHDVGQDWALSPDISAVVQEVVDRSDWSAGNAIDILFSCTNQPSEDLQFLAYGYCWSDGYCTTSKYRPATLEVSYVP